MSAAFAHLSPRHALRLVAEHGGREKTAEQLRHEAEAFEQDAERRERLAISSLAGNRRKARQKAKVRRAEESRANAKLVSLAAAEVERRKAKTVGEAMRSPFVRFFVRLRRGLRRG